MGGLFYADSKGVVAQYGEGSRPTASSSAPDEKTLYVRCNEVANAAQVWSIRMIAQGDKGRV
jgi:hypothetical protein